MHTACIYISIHSSWFIGIFAQFGFTKTPTFANQSLRSLYLMLLQDHFDLGVLKVPIVKALLTRSFGGK